jgi:hypothetical protein
MQVLLPLQLPMQVVSAVHELLFAHAANCALQAPLCADV